MNTLEGLKQRLMVKPIVENQKQFTIAIKKKITRKRKK